MAFPKAHEMHSRSVLSYHRVSPGISASWEARLSVGHTLFGKVYVNHSTACQD